MLTHLSNPSPKSARCPLQAVSVRRSRPLALLLLFWHWLIPSQGLSQNPSGDQAEPTSDVVVVRGSRGELVRLTGTVVEYSGEGLLLRPRVGPDRTVSAERVLAVETKRQPGFLEAQAEKAAGRIERALALLRDAMSKDSRPWARREIAAEMVRCSQAAGNDLVACELFLQLISEDPRTPYMDCIPLAWTPDQQTSALENAAKAWLRDSRPAAQLLGASYLLLGPTGAEAAARLRSLALGREGDSRIALLAAAQLWRSQAFTAPAEEIERWEQIAEKLPLPYRGGPYYVIALAWMHRRQANRAVTLYLKVGLLCDNPRPLVARCLWEAANAPQKTEWKEDAARVESLRRELTLRFPETRWTRQQAPSDE